MNEKFRSSIKRVKLPGKQELKYLEKKGLTTWKKKVKIPGRIGLNYLEE